MAASRHAPRGRVPAFGVFHCPGDLERRPAGARAGLRALPTAGELERDDACAPGPDHDRVLGQVLLRVPEGAVVGRVDGQLAVVAPAALDLRLRPGAGEPDLLGL